MEILKEKSLIELKSIAYDILAEQQRLNQLLQTVNQAIVEKTNQTQKEEQPKDKEESIETVPK